MYEERMDELKQYAARLKELHKCLNVDGKKEEMAQLEAKMNEQEFWNDPAAAQKIVQKLKLLRSAVEGPEKLGAELEDALVLVELAQAEEDESLAEEIDEICTTIQQRLNKLELTSLFDDPRDARKAIVSIHPGAGGTESCDWAGMLYRMIQRYCERHDFKTELVDYQPGEEAGIKSVTITVEGLFAYGNLKSEEGVHRLVRISPFDANKRRHTSFAAVEVLPELDDEIEIEIREEDIKMDVFRSSGAGGQHVNKTSSAVRLTHLPTGIVASCQMERSQHRNREVAMQMLKAKLYDIEVKKQEAELAALRDGQMEVAWGSQIRSYVLQPYQMIKDHRTEVETSNVDRVLDGELDMFIEAYLKWNLQRRMAGRKAE